MKYAVIRTGGKQYLIKKGDIFKIEKINFPVNEKINFKEILLVFDKDKIWLGKPLLDGFKVQFKILAQGKGKKVRIIKYKPKIRYHKKNGHRQPYTMIKILDINFIKSKLAKVT